jgi:hypothetical protein
MESGGDRWKKHHPKLATRDERPVENAEKSVDVPYGF